MENLIIGGTEIVFVEENQIKEIIMMWESVVGEIWRNIKKKFWSLAQVIFKDHKDVRQKICRRKPGKL